MTMFVSHYQTSLTLIEQLGLQDLQTDLTIQLGKFRIKNIKLFSWLVNRNIGGVSLAGYDDFIGQKYMIHQKYVKILKLSYSSGWIWPTNYHRHWIYRFILLFPLVDYEIFILNLFFQLTTGLRLAGVYFSVSPPDCEGLSVSLQTDRAIISELGIQTILTQ